ncbi:MAG TPA: hypothetical protein VGC72_03960 [Candidatus Elarobacter sp.]
MLIFVRSPSSIIAIVSRCNLRKVLSLDHRYGRLRLADLLVEVRFANRVLQISVFVDVRRPRGWTGSIDERSRRLLGHPFCCRAPMAPPSMVTGASTYEKAGAKTRSDERRRDSDEVR